jgi:hypothetical protein
MNPEDPIEKLERHYARLRQLPVPAASMKLRWWEAVGGLVAGAAAVVLAVSICTSGAVQASVQPGPTLLRQQMRSAGLTPEPELPPKRAQRETVWAI